jgi:hypothetical protein
VPSFTQYIGQIAAYGAFVVGIGYFSVFPAYEHLGPDAAMIKLAFSHAGAHREECRRLTPEELARLPTNRRQVGNCSRERVPVALEVELDGRQVFNGLQEPTGLWSDGPSHVYQRFPVPAGTHLLSARLRDSRREDGGFDYVAERRVELKPGQNFVIGFRTEAGGFTFE